MLITKVPIKIKNLKFKTLKKCRFHRQKYHQFWTFEKGSNSLSIKIFFEFYAGRRGYVCLLSQMFFGDIFWKQKVNFLFVGDTLYAESEVKEKRESKSRPDDGIVTVKTIGKNQDGTIVASYLRSALIPKKGKAVEDKIDY